jgi:hypothetical protein
VSRDEREDIIEIIKSDPAQESFFFREVRDPEWLPLLYGAGYFDGSRAPAPEQLVDGTSTFSDWHLLRFLNRVLEESQTHPTVRSYGPIIADLVRNVGRCHKGNVRTIFWLAKILSRLPREYITLDLISLVDDWFVTSCEADWIAADLAALLLPALLRDQPSSEDVEKAELLLQILMRVRYPSSDDSATNTFAKPVFWVPSYWLRQGVDAALPSIVQHFGERGISRIEEQIRELLRYAARNYSRDLTYESVQLRLRLEAPDLRLTFEVSGSAGGELLGRWSDVPGDRDEFVTKYGSRVLDCLKSSALDSAFLDHTLRRLHAIFHGVECYSALNDQTSKNDDDPIDFVVGLYLQICHGRLKAAPNFEDERLMRLFSESYLLFSKIGLVLLSELLPQKRKLFWRSLHGPNGDVLLEELFFGEEIRVVLSRLAPLSAGERSLLADAIERGSVLWDEDRSEMDRKVWKQRRYKALRGDSFFSSEYDRLRSETGIDVELRAAFGPIQVGWSRSASPVTPEELRQRDHRQLAQYLESFKPESFEIEVTASGLARTLEVAVGLDPTHFLGGLDKFQSLPYIWVRSLLRGFSEAAASCDLSVWMRLLDFIEAYTGRQAFWRDAYGVLTYDDVFHPNHEWVLREFCSIVSQALQKKSVRLGAKPTQRIVHLVGQWLDRMHWPSSPSYDDPVTQAVNATGGQLIDIYLRVLLYRSPKAPKRETGVRWSQVDRDRMNRLVREAVPEALTLVGMYFANLHYLDAGWVREVTPSLLLNAAWKNFIVGYLHHAPFFRGLFELVRPHLEAALQERSLLDKRSQNALIEHATLAYLHGLEDSDVPGVLSALLRDGRPDEIREVAAFVGRVAIGAKRGTTPGDFEKLRPISARSIDLWHRLLAHIESTAAPDGSEVAVNLLEFTAYLPELDERAEKLLIRTIECGLPSNREYPFFLQYLVAVVKRSAKPEAASRLGRIYKGLLKYCLPSFQQSDVRKLLEVLYVNKGTTDVAHYIVDFYGRRGHDFLAPLFEKYRK